MTIRKLLLASALLTASLFAVAAQSPDANPYLKGDTWGKGGHTLKNMAHLRQIVLQCSAEPNFSQMYDEHLVKFVVESTPRDNVKRILGEIEAFPAFSDVVQLQRGSEDCAWDATKASQILNDNLLQLERANEIRVANGTALAYQKTPVDKGYLVWDQSAIEDMGEGRTTMQRCAPEQANEYIQWSRIYLEQTAAPTDVPRIEAAIQAYKPPAAEVKLQPPGSRVCEEIVPKLREMMQKEVISATVAATDRRAAADDIASAKRQKQTAEPVTARTKETWNEDSIDAAASGLAVMRHCAPKEVAARFEANLTSYVQQTAPAGDAPEITHKIIAHAPYPSVDTLAVNGDECTAMTADLTKAMAETMGQATQAVLLRRKSTSLPRP
jgi:hypothetical protein